MESWLSRITDYLLAQSWQIAVLTVVVAIVSFLLRNRSAHVRYLIWLLVLAKCLVPPLHSVPLAVLPQEQPIAFVESSPMAGRTFDASRIERDIVTEPAMSASVRTPMAPPPKTTNRPSTYNIRVWLALGWLVGAVALLFYNLLNALRTQIWLLRQRKTLPVKFRHNIESFFSAHGVKHIPNVWLINGMNQPFVWGLVRGSIYLPADLLNFRDSKSWASLLGHELSHVIRFDAMVHTLQIFAQVVFWFHPFVWWANRKIRAEREKCCDEMAIVSLHALPEDYSEAIVEALAVKYESIRPVPSLAVAGPVKNIEERIKTMLRPGKKFYKRPSLVAATTVFLLALLTVPSNIVLTTRAESQSTNAGGDKPAGSLPELAVDTGPSFSNPTNLGPTVNSSDSEFDPSISADGLSLYFNSYRPGGSGEADIWVTTRKTTTDPWGTPVNLGTVVNSSTNDTAPDISADGLSLYFSSDRSGGDGARDLWVTTRETTSAPWGTPINLGPTVNSSGNDHGPSISADGLSLYFSGYAASGPFRSGGFGGGDLWVTTRKTKDDPWTEPVNLGPKVNYSGWDASPSISVDGLTLYFNSSRDGGFGGPDLWVTTRKTKDDPWGNAVNLGPTVNGVESDMNPDISDDGSMLYFASARPGAVGDSDLWQVLFEKGTEASSLHSAAFTGALVKVKAFLDAGVNVNEKNDAGVTALYAAVIRGHKNVIELLLTKGADINASVMTNGRTPLHCATKADVAGFLIAKGADINAKDNEGRIPLHSFAKAGSKDVVELLISKGADVNVKDNNGQTPLDIAVLRNHKDIVELLTAKDADYSPQVAARLGLLEEITKLVKKGTDINIKDASGRTALHHAARAGHKEMVELLLANGADVNIGEKHYNRTAAEFAMIGNHKEVVELLISKGADISPLHFALYMKDQVKAKSLIEGGADVNKWTPYGTTPLHRAADEGFKDIAGLLIDRGADVNAKDNWNWTPLHNAVYGHKDMVELLIAKGANVNARDGGGRTPLWYAQDEGHTEIVELLRKHGAKE